MFTFSVSSLIIWEFINEYRTNLAIQIIRVRVNSSLGTVANLIYAAKMTVFRVARKKKKRMCQKQQVAKLPGFCMCICSSLLIVKNLMVLCGCFQNCRIAWKIYF